MVPVVYFLSHAMTLNLFMIKYDTDRRLFGIKTEEAKSSEIGRINLALSFEILFLSFCFSYRSIGFLKSHASTVSLCYSLRPYALLLGMNVLFLTFTCLNLTFHSDVSVQIFTLIEHPILDEWPFHIIGLSLTASTIDTICSFYERWLMHGWLVSSMYRSNTNPTEMEEHKHDHV